MHAIDHFIVKAILEFRARVEVLSAMDLLVYSGDDWPQPHPLLEMKHLPWEQWPTKQELINLQERLRNHDHINS